MSTSKEFGKLYKTLNTKQKEAVDTVEGPVMVIAGPGTGKTQILTLRIANILLKTNIDPENILALTFTESGVASMRKRLIEIMGSPAYLVNINTFHGFCNDIIKEYPENFSNVIGSENMTEVEQIEILQSILEGSSFKDLKTFGDPFYYLRSILSAISSLKGEGVSVKEFERVVNLEIESFELIEDLYHEKGAHKGRMKGEYQKLEKQLNKNKELIEIYKQYQDKLKERKLYDYSDMIMKVLEVLGENKNLLLTFQEQYQYFLVDEHQDTNNAQNKILELLVNYHDNPNIFVVGDEKQAIFRFQGASLENFLYFKNLYPSAKLINLEENYRSTQEILDSAHSLLAGEKSFKSNISSEGKLVEIYSFTKPEVEFFFLARDIKEKIREGIIPDEIAVFYRDNKDAFPIAEMLRKFDVPFIIESNQNVLEDLDIKKLIKLLRIVDDFGYQEKLIEVMHIDFLNIEPLDLYKLIKYSNKNKIPIIDLIKSAETLKFLKLENPEILNEFYKKLRKWTITDKNKMITTTFEEVASDSGFISYILKKRDSADMISKLNNLFDEVRSLVGKHKEGRVCDLLKYIDMLSEHNVLVKKKTSFKPSGKVRLMTAHKSKGLEFEHVYITQAYDGHWSNKRSPNLLPLPSKIYSLSGSDVAGDKNDDERRLFYVALTRAKKGISISYSREGLTNKEQLPSQFIQEIKSELIDIKDVDSIEKEFKKEQENIFKPAKEQGINVKDKEFIKDLFYQRGFSVTALNNYLKCPWNYFYSNLLRTPRASTKHQLYGIAVHEALKEFFNKLKNEDVSKKYLLERFAYHLKQQPLLDNELEETLKRGEEALDGYYDKYSGSWIKNIITEENITGVLLDDIRLTGKIDKIEFLENSNEVNVVDYKTGKPKSRNAIEGKTKSDDGGIGRQLVFYKLLLDKYKDGKYKMNSSEIDFVQPNEKGKYIKEKFIISDKEVKELEDLIRQTTDEIVSLKFWDKGCNDKDCEFCQLRGIM